MSTEIMSKLRFLSIEPLQLDLTSARGAAHPTEGSLGSRMIELESLDFTNKKSNSLGQSSILSTASRVPPSTRPAILN